MARLSLAAAVAVLALASGAASQAPGPSPPVDCTASVTGLVTCLPYVQQGSTQGKPASECCAGVKAALKSPATVACLCAAFGQNYGIQVNLTRAAGLPAACGEDHAALSKCNSQFLISGSLLLVRFFLVLICDYYNLYDLFFSPIPIQYSKSLLD